MSFTLLFHMALFVVPTKGIFLLLIIVSPRRAINNYTSALVKLAKHCSVFYTFLSGFLDGTSVPAIQNKACTASDGSFKLYFYSAGFPPAPTALPKSLLTYRKNPCFAAACVWVGLLAGLPRCGFFLPYGAAAKARRYYPPCTPAHFG